MAIEKEWLEQRYIKDLASVTDIAADAGCGVANIRRCLKKWSIRRGKAFIEGKPAWNSGLTKLDDERVAAGAKSKEGENNPMFGRPAWNAGLTKDSDERIANVARSLTGRSPDDKTRDKMRFAKLGKSGADSNAWRGGTQYSNGYGVKRISVSGRRVYMHRHVAEKALGRTLLTDEQVHHVDKRKHNNSPDNLIVLLTDDHNRLHRAIEAGFVSYDEQVMWLKSNKVYFVEVKNEDSERKAA